MNRNSSPLSSRWAVVLLAASVLALTGCGRKGPLDLPPTGSQSSNVAPTDTEAERAATPSVFNPTYGATRRRPPPKAPRNRSFLIRS